MTRSGCCQAFELDTLDIDDLDRLATSAYLTGHDEEGFGYWVRAHQMCVGEGALHRAAYFGMRLGQGLGFKGDLGRCRGWVDRTARLLEDAGIDCVEQGYLEWGLAMMQLFEAGDVAGAHAHFVQAGKIGTRFAHRELVTLARIGEGRMLIYLGENAEGMALLDEAMVSIEARELSPLATGDAYCTVIDACAELFDLGRCRSWTESFTRWCDTQQELVLYRGHCFLHRAEMLELLGAWPEALVEARHACDRLAAPVNPAALSGACMIEGDLLRLVGDFDGAEACVSAGPRLRARPTTRPRVAATCPGPPRRRRRDDPPRRRRDRGPDLARAHARRLRRDPARDGRHRRRPRCGRGAPWDRRGARNAATCAHTPPGQPARCCLAEGDANAALLELRRAFNELHALGVRYDAACTRLLVAEACQALGDLDGAGMESSSARSVLESLGATPTLGTIVQPAASPPDGLTERELEVLVLLARGKTNRVIAHELFISEKTVASHVSHIFTKLGVTSRSAATAYAYDHHLV